MGAKRKVTVRRKIYVNRVIRNLWSEHKQYLLEQNKLRTMTTPLSYAGKSGGYRLLTSTDGGIFTERFRKVTREFCEGYIQAIHDSNQKIFVEARLPSNGDNIIFTYPFSSK